MRNPFARQRRPARRRPQRPRGPMARTRRLMGYRVLKILLAGGGATLLMASLVTLANGVVNLRSEIENLQGEFLCLESRYAQRVEQWNQVSAHAVVTARAEKELGLVLSDGPGHVIVVMDEAKERKEPAWRRVLGRVGGGEPIPAVSAQGR